MTFEIFISCVMIRAGIANFITNLIMKLVGDIRSYGCFDHLGLRATTKQDKIGHCFIWRYLSWIKKLNYWFLGTIWTMDINVYLLQHSVSKHFLNVLSQCSLTHCNFVIKDWSNTEYDSWNVEYNDPICNVRLHIARVTLDRFEFFNVNLLPWSTRSSELSPIEQFTDHRQGEVVWNDLNYSY